jgi:hypothetical protein
MIFFIQCSPKVMVGFHIIRLLEWNTIDTWNRWNWRQCCGGGGGEQLRTQRIQGDAQSQSDLHKMATVHRKIQRVLWLAKFEYVTQVRRGYRRVLNGEPPHENCIRRWDRQLKGTGNLLHRQRSGRPSVSDESVENIRNSFIRSPKNCVGLSKSNCS